MRRHPRLSLFWAIIPLALCLGSCSTELPDQPTTIAEIKTALHSEQHADRVKFQGVVTVENPNFGFIVVQDQTAGIRVEPTKFIETSLQGHKVEIFGALPAGNSSEQISDASIKDLGLAKMPEPLTISTNELKTDSFDGKLVSLQGVARLGKVDANGQLVVPLRLGGFEVSVRFTDDRGLDMEQIVDANIEVTGVASVGVDIHGNLTDLTILAGSATAVKVLTAPPDPASLPVEDLKSIMGRSTPADHRVRLRGVL